jgi:hypothetical protein
VFHPGKLAFPVLASSELFAGSITSTRNTLLLQSASRVDPQLTLRVTPSRGAGAYQAQSQPAVAATRPDPTKVPEVTGMLLVARNTAARQQFFHPAAPAR